MTGIKILSDKLYRFLYIILFRLYLFACFFLRPAVYGVYIAVWHGNKILIIRNSYKTQLTLPGGGIRRGENEKQAAIRELQEEMNLTIAPTNIRFVKRYAAYHGYRFETGAFFEINFSDPPKIKIDNREVIWADFITPSSAKKSNLSPLVKLYLEDYII